jgi:hypothetical protein
MDGWSIDCYYGIPIHEVSSGLLSKNKKKYYSLDTMLENAVQRSSKDSKETPKRQECCCNDVTQSM